MRQHVGDPLALIFGRIDRRDHDWRGGQHLLQTFPGDEKRRVTGAGQQQQAAVDLLNGQGQGEVNSHDQDSPALAPYPSG
ncbi:hypothetical protein K7H20_24155 [Salipiger manganoxidans]|uniref:hypothetical protein n=1 Tax=Salipiger marinus TaxID=555512 RepID=UPI001E302B80|nr:hypothetical protein [Salipiger manganoxidans]MCD1621135.1 hypothetical protein [Salipiger manganoxidans]